MERQANRELAAGWDRGQKLQCPVLLHCECRYAVTPGVYRIEMAIIADQRVRIETGYGAIAVATGLVAPQKSQHPRLGIAGERLHGIRTGRVGEDIDGA